MSPIPATKFIACLSVLHRHRHQPQSVSIDCTHTEHPPYTCTHRAWHRHIYWLPPRSPWRCHRDALPGPHLAWGSTAGRGVPHHVGLTSPAQPCSCAPHPRALLCSWVLRRSHRCTCPRRCRRRFRRGLGGHGWRHGGGGRGYGGSCRLGFERRDGGQLRRHDLQHGLDGRHDLRGGGPLVGVLAPALPRQGTAGRGRGGSWNRAGGSRQSGIVGGGRQHAPRRAGRTEAPAALPLAGALRRLPAPVQPSSKHR